ncbi:prostaglandin E2 receptor EP4 subtype-like isoform X3 [Clavelina lepadiformis]|uniref:prostaglandin E2 receptor EP4 subtype-like isoform X3 n=1 Tax=Clavelina lepadiformis TaxID=159417 RepID=UPI0040422C1D
MSISVIVYCLNKMKKDEDFPFQNNSCFNLTNSTCQSSHRHSMTLQVLIPLISIIGNVIAIAVICKNKRNKKQSIFYTLVMTLAGVDLLSTLLVSSLTLISRGTGKSLLELGGKALCDYSGFIMIYIGAVSMGILCTMAVDRLLALRFAFFYQRNVTNGKAKVVIFAVLSLFFILSALPLFGFGEIIQQSPGTWCFINWHASQTKDQVYNIMFAMIGSIMMLVVIFSNIFVINAVVKKKKKNAVKKCIYENNDKRSNSPNNTAGNADDGPTCSDDVCLYILLPSAFATHFDQSNRRNWSNSNALQSKVGFICSACCRY